MKNISKTLDTLENDRKLWGSRGTLDDFLNRPLKARYYFGIFYKTPVSLVWGEWKKWEMFLVVNHPIQYFVREVLWDGIRFFFKRVDRRYYTLKCRFWRKYHLLNLGPYYHWIDASHKVELALEKILIDFVEQENPFEVCVWDEMKEQKKVIQDAYDWFKFLRPIKQKEYDNLLSKLYGSESKFDEIMSGREETPEETAEKDKLWQMEEEIFKENTKWYQKIVEIRGYLWT